MKWLKVILPAWVLLVVSGCTAFKAVKYGNPSVDTYRHFALDTVARRDTVRKVLISSSDHDRYFEDARFSGGGFNGETIAEYFSRVRGAGALLIVRNDTILLEQYFGYFRPDYPSNIFSVTKAVTSLLCGIAVDEGLMSVSDPVTRYIPELEEADTCFRQLTIEHLLDMRTGLDFRESYGWNPFSRMARLYYGGDVVRQFRRLHFREAPGTSHYYNSMSTALLGVAIERAVGRPFASYLEEKVWKPLDMESDAFISLDDSKHRQAKAYGGLVTNARDLAKIGRLYLNGGCYGDRRIVSRDWIDRSTHSLQENSAYSYGWNNIIENRDGRKAISPRFFALGLYGQVLFCDPERNLIFVTLGEDKGCEYHLLFDSLCQP